MIPSSADIPERIPGSYEIPGDNNQAGNRKHT